MYLLNNKNVASFDDYSAIRCDGTVSVYIILKDGQELNVSGLTPSAEKTFVAMLKSKKEQTVKIDPIMLMNSDELHKKHYEIWARRNGINC